MQARLVRLGAICFGIMLVLTVFSLFSKSIHIGFFGYILMLLFGTVFTTIGVAIGDAFRRFVMPDLLFAAGAYDMFLKRIFWLVGPQAIGWFIGLVATQGLLRQFGY